MDFVVGGNFQEMHGTFAPGIERFDPGRCAALVEHPVIEIVGEVAVALQEAEAFRIHIGEGVGHDAGRIVQGPPDALAVAQMQGQPVGIVNFRPPVGGLLAARFPIPEHGRERGNTEPGDITAGEKAGVHDHGRQKWWCVGLRFSLDLEPIGACGARTIQERMDDERAAFGSLDVEFAEAGKFLRRGETRVDGEPPRGKAVLVERTRRAEIRGAKECEPVGFQVPRHDAEASESQSVGKQAGGMAVWAVEDVGGREDFAGTFPINDVDTHGLLEILAHVKKLNRMTALFRTNRPVGTKFDLLVGVVVDPIQNVGGDDFGCREWLERQCGGACPQRLSRKWRRRAEHRIRCGGRRCRVEPSQRNGRHRGQQKTGRLTARETMYHGRWRNIRPDPGCREKGSANRE